MSQEHTPKLVVCFQIFIGLSKKKESIYKLTKVCPTPVITRKLRALKGPQVRTITRYGTGSVILFNCAERNSLVKQSEQSPTDIVYTGDYSLRFVREFRTDRLTRHVPLSVRFVLRNDSKNWNRSSVCQHVYSYPKKL